MKLEKFTEIFKKVNHFDRAHHLEFKVNSPGDIEYYLQVQEQHLSSPQTAHGGVIAAMMDCTLGFSALSLAATKGHLTSTVEFKMNFIRPALLGQKLIGKGRVEHSGKSLIISTGEIFLESGELVAKGQGTFNTYPMDKKDFSSAL